MILLLLLDKPVDSVKGAAPVIAYYSSSAVGIGKSCDISQMAHLSHLGRVGLEHAVVVGGHVVEHEVYLLRKLFSMLGKLFSHHSDPAERADSAL